MNKKELEKAMELLSIIKPSNADGRENQWKRKAREEYLIASNVPKADIKIELGAKQDKEERLTPAINKLPKFKLFSNDKGNSSSDKENSTVIENEIKGIIKEQMKKQLQDIDE